ncbi:MAG: IS630 family transposase, partial [Cyanobacteria bacterium SW_7_48_12]
REEYPYGYCEIGKSFHALKSANAPSESVGWPHSSKKNKQEELFAPITFSGSCNRDLFERWLEQSLLPQLQPGDVIVIDNASFHRCHPH